MGEPLTFLRFTSSGNTIKSTSFIQFGVFEPPIFLYPIPYYHIKSPFTAHPLDFLGPWRPTDGRPSQTPPLSQERHGLVMVKGEQMQNGMSLEGKLTVKNWDLTNNNRDMT